jgi:trigger factor
VAFETKVEQLETAPDTDAATARVALSVTLDAAQVDASVRAVLKEVSARIRIPGFRPGKAPRGIIEGQVGSDYILANALEKLVNDSYPLALDREELRSVGKADFADPPSLVEGESYTYTVNLTLRPELKLATTKIAITMPPREATEAEIDQQIEMTRERFASYPAAAKTAKIKKDGFATISFTSTIDGEEYEGSSVSRHLYRMGQHMMPPAFEEALVGHLAGDEVAVEFVVEDNGQNSEFVGKTMHFTVTIEEVNKKELPPIDDAMATSVGFENLEEMRTQIASYINSQKEQSWDRERDDRLIDALTKELDGEPTPALVEARAESLTAEFERMLDRSKVTLADYLEQAKIDPEQFSADMRERAHISAANDLALEALARAEGLIPDEAGLAEEFEQMAEASDTTPDAARKRWEKQGLITMLRDDAARRRALAWLRDNADLRIDETETING